MQAFNFFVVATAFLIAAYASLLEKHPAAALVLAVVGAWLAFWFDRLEARSRQLVKAGERALAASQARLASLAENPDFKILDAVEKTAPGGFSFRRVINVIQWTIFVLFLFGAGYATWLAINGSAGLGLVGLGSEKGAMGICDVKKLLEVLTAVLALGAAGSWAAVAWFGWFDYLHTPIGLIQHYPKAAGHV